VAADDTVIETERFRLRGWRDSDAAPLLAINDDKEVARYLGPIPSPEDCAAAVARQHAFQQALGHCFWAMERKEDGAFLGFCGLKPGLPDSPIADDIEIGWRLGRAYWGCGYAREAAQACLAWGWSNLGIPRIAAITVLGNVRSWGLMERLGMVRRPDLDFLHPKLAEGDPLRPHIAYVAERP
jgi:RimJ/RimL family protein N-acetyltransferase